MVLAGTGGLIAAMILAVPGIASASTLTCGETITTSTTLTSNLNCTSDTTTDALYIGAAGVTLNLNGHKILGPGDSAQTEGIADTGATSTSGPSTGYSDVTVENGSLSNFSTDVDIEGTSGGDLTGIVVQHLSTTDKSLESSTSVYGGYLDGASFSHVTSADANTGLELEYSEDSTVSGNTVNYGSLALDDYEGDADTWSGNTIKDGQDCGVGAAITTADVVQGNTVTGTGYNVGVCSTGNDDITITGNTFDDVHNGVNDGFSNDGTISGNTGTGDSWGIYTYFSTDYTISGNTFGHGEYGIETDNPNGEVLTGNTANDNTEAGVYVWISSTTNGYSATLTSNTGNKNRFGLYSTIPTTGSANHASGNKVVNCHNVKCAKAKGGHSRAAPPHHAQTVRPAPARRAPR